MSSLENKDSKAKVIWSVLQCHRPFQEFREVNFEGHPALVKEIFNIIKQINQEEKTTILLVEQNAKMALSVAQHGYILEVGSIVMDDTTQKLSENEDVQEFYLGMREEGIRGARRWKKKKQWR